MGRMGRMGLMGRYDRLATNHHHTNHKSHKTHFPTPTDSSVTSRIIPPATQALNRIPPLCPNSPPTRAFPRPCG